MRYILDACAIIAFLSDEDGADVVEGLLRRAEAGEIELLMHYINLGEVYYHVFRNDGEDEANNVYALITQLPIRFLNIREDILLMAGKVKATQRVSYADAFAIAVSLVEDGILVTADHHEIEPLEAQDLIAVEWIR